MLFRPITYLKRLFSSRIALQFAAVIALSATPAAYLLYEHIETKQYDIHFSQQEQRGSGMLISLYRLPPLLLAFHRLDFDQNGRSIAEMDAEAAQIKQKIDATLQDIARLENCYQSELKLSPELLAAKGASKCASGALIATWDLLQKEQAKQSANAAFDDSLFYAQMWESIDCLTAHIGDTSNLVLDGDLDTYYLMSAGMLHAPALIHQFHLVQSILEEESGATRTQEQLIFWRNLQANFYDQYWRRVFDNIMTAAREDDTSYGRSENLQKLAQSLTQYDRDYRKLQHQILSLDLEHADSLAGDKAVLFNRQFLSAADQLMDIQNEALATLNQMIQARVDTLQSHLWKSVAITLSFLAFCIGTATILIRSLHYRIKMVSVAARRVSLGDLQARSNVRSPDEVGMLGKDFDHMTNILQKTQESLAEKQAALALQNSNLEHVIEERTRTIRMILDNVTVGFLLLDRDCQIQSEYTQSCHDILDTKTIANTSLQNVLGMSDTDFVNLSIAIEQFFDDMLDESMLLDQVPPHIKLPNARQTVISFEPRAIRNAQGEVIYVLVTIKDITELERISQKDAENTKLITILQQKPSFKNFLRDAKNLLEQSKEAITNQDHKLLRRSLHTIKGNAGMFGIDFLVQKIHHIESHEEISFAMLHDIDTELRTFLSKYENILGIDYNNPNEEILSLRGEQIADLHRWLGHLAQTLPPQEQRTLQRWEAELALRPVGDLLGPIDHSIQRMAGRLKKSIAFTFFGKYTLVDAQVMGPICANLEHLIRNALDHGIEVPSERVLYNLPKNPVGALQLNITSYPEYWQLTLSDDGRGISGDLVARKALKDGKITEQQYNSMTENEKVNLILLDGLSTASEATDLSGRGVGMSAVYASVIAQGGSFTIKTVVGQGTTFMITVPKPKILLIERIKTPMPMAAVVFPSPTRKTA